MNDSECARWKDREMIYNYFYAIRYDPAKLWQLMGVLEMERTAANLTKMVDFIEHMEKFLYGEQTSLW